MGVLKDNQLIWSCFPAFLGFEVLADGLAQNRMPHIFLFVQNVGYCGTVPAAGVMVAVITAFSMFGLLQICRGDQHIISGQLIGYGLASHAINNHLVNPANNLCGFFINQKMVFVLWVTLVPIGDCAAAPLAILHPGTENRSYFVAGVLCVPLIHDVQKRREVVFHRIGTVYAVVDGDKADTFSGNMISV